MADERHGKVTQETRAAERHEVNKHGEADRPPTAEEEELAEEQELEPGVAEHYEEMAEKGASTRGEGRIEP